MQANLISIPTINFLTINFLTIETILEAQPSLSLLGNLMFHRALFTLLVISVQIQLL